MMYGNKYYRVIDVNTVKQKISERHGAQSHYSYFFDNFYIYERNEIIYKRSYKWFKSIKSENFIFCDKSHSLKLYENLKDIRELLLYSGSVTNENTLKICPYCSMGEVQSGGTLDHFLPKEQFFQLAATPINLVPCCSRCNTNKGETYKSGQVTLFHPFFEDLFPCYFDFEIRVPNPDQMLIATIVPHSSLAASDKNRVNLWIDTFKLSERYRDDIYSRMLEFRKIVQEDVIAGKKDEDIFKVLKQTLLDSINSRMTDVRPHVKLFYEKIVLDDEIINYIISSAK